MAAKHEINKIRKLHFENYVIPLHEIFNMMDNYSVVDRIFKVYKHFVMKKETTYFENIKKLESISFHEI